MTTLSIRFAASALALAATLAAQGATYRISLNSAHQQAAGRSLNPSCSRDGLLTAFMSFAPDLVTGDLNGLPDIFVKDVITGTIERISVGLSGAEANGPSRSPRLSADGRFVAFESDATNLVNGDSNGYADVFLFDRVLRRTTRVSVANNGMQADLPCGSPSVSTDGRYVAFLSMATNLVAGDNNNYQDVFVHDRLTRQTTRESVSTQGMETDDDNYSPSISGDGRWVAFSSGGTNLVSGDNNNFQDVFIRDRVAGQTTRVSLGTSGTEANDDSLSPVLGSDGRFVAFHSHASNLVTGDNNNRADVFRVDRNTMTTVRASVDSSGAEDQAESTLPAMSENGRWVAFISDANLAPRNGPFPDVFVRDLDLGTTTIHSISSDGLESSDWNGAPAISGDGRYVAWPSLADNIVGDDTNFAEDILINEVSHHLTASGHLRIGQTTTMTLSSPRDPGKIYFCLAAWNTEFGTRLGGRLFPLDTDTLLRACLGMPTVFGNVIGNLDQNGSAMTTATMPNNPVLVNLELVLAYTVVDNAFPTGFQAMSNAWSFLVRP